jgi:hypothetical protein
MFFNRPDKDSLGPELATLGAQKDTDWRFA